MSLVDDARRLEEAEPVNPLTRCYWCEEFTLTEPHAPDCPWLSLPRILAALEAAERVATVTTRQRIMAGAGPTRRCFYCGDKYAHTQDCPWQTLVAALQEPA